MEIIIQILITMAFSAFFSGMEIAFVSSNKLRFEMDRNEQSITSRILSIFYHNPNNFISTMLVGNNIALVIYGILMAELIEQNLLAGYITNEFLLVLTQTIISTLIILVTGEFVPKTLFKINPNFTLNLFALPTFICYIVLYPISKFASGISGILLLLTGTKINKEASEKAFTKVDLDHFIQSSIQDVENEEEINTEVKIFQNAIDFTDTHLRDCMIPRNEMVAVNIDHADRDSLCELFTQSGFSKIIVYHDDIDSVLGYIHVSEMFNPENNWKKCIKPVLFVPESMLANKMMEKLLKQKRSVAIVVDEFGGTAGLVTLEDLVEEIFGEIEDEHDRMRFIAKEIEPGVYQFSGRMEIEEINEEYPIELPESDEYQTLAGYLLYQMEVVPRSGDKIEVDGIVFTIEKMVGARIDLVRVEMKGQE